MAQVRRAARTMYGYTVDEVSRFLQYDPAAVRYWLRTGHLAGAFDPAIDDWRVTANDLVIFLRQSSEPMPTGVVVWHDAPATEPASAPVGEAALAAV